MSISPGIFLSICQCDGLPRDRSGRWLNEDHKDHSQGCGNLQHRVMKQILVSEKPGTIDIKGMWTQCNVPNNVETPDMTVSDRLTGETEDASLKRRRAWRLVQ